MVRYGRLYWACSSQSIVFVVIKIMNEVMTVFFYQQVAVYEWMVYIFPCL